MATCSLCGKSCGLMNGGKEPYTGEELYLCNDCGLILKQLHVSSKNADEKSYNYYQEQLKKLNAKNQSFCKEIINQYMEKVEKIFEKAEAEKDMARNASRSIEFESHVCPICKAAIPKETFICPECGYSLKEDYLSIEQKKEIIHCKQRQILKNAFYEYKVEIIRDSLIRGTVKQSKIEDTIMRYALNGWRLHSVVMNEIGKNAVSGINATTDQLIIIFERCIKPEE